MWESRLVGPVWVKVVRVLRLVYTFSTALGNVTRTAFKCSSVSLVSVLLYHVACRDVLCVGLHSVFQLFFLKASHCPLLETATDLHTLASNRGPVLIQCFGQ